MKLINNTNASVLDRKVTVEVSLKELLTIFCALGTSSISETRGLREKYYPQFSDEDIGNTAMEDATSHLYQVLGNTILPSCNLPPKEF